MASAQISSLLSAILLALALPASAIARAPATNSAADFAPRRVAADFATMVGRLFLYPDVAHRYAAAIRRHAAAGAYDGITDRRALAARLTADVQAVAPEGHLRVLAGEGAAPSASRPPSLSDEWIAPGIAYLRLNDLMGSSDTLDRLDRFLSTYDKAQSLIIDLRDNSGGGVAEMDMILPWLYRQPTRLMRMDSRTGVGRNPLANMPSMRQEPAPKGIQRYDHWVSPRVPPAPLADALVCVLTSRRTISAAEHLALALQHSGRAQIIGERTSGAGHYGPIVPLADGFAAFIPVGRSYRADTGRGWEGVGVLPDVPVPEQEALAAALSICAPKPRKAGSGMDTDKVLQSSPSQ